MTVSNIGKNIVVDVQGSQEQVEPGGQAYQRYITIKNGGKKPAKITLWLTTKDTHSQQLLRWYSLIENSPHSYPSDEKREISIENLEPDQKRNITLTIQVPQTAEPGTYNYEIRAEDAENQGESVLRPQQFQVRPSKQYLESRNEPSFTVEPQTSSEQPYELAPGDRFPLKITVENRSRHVDRFFIAFPELDNSWFENYIHTLSADGLPLNPGEIGSFNLLLRPPEHTPAGQYFSTIRLKSETTNLVFLDIVYFNIQIDQRLTLDLSPASRKFPTADSSFEITVYNPGNIQRHLQIQAHDEEGLFLYKIEPASLKLERGQEGKFSLNPQPKKGWRRGWSEGQTIPFHLQISNIQSFIDNTEFPAVTLDLPENPSGTIIWQPRPSWQRFLFTKVPKLLLLGLLLLVLGLLIDSGCKFAYSWVWQSIVKPSLQPNITEFSSIEKTYQAGQDDGIRVNWEIRNLGQLSQIVVTPYHFIQPSSNTKSLKPLLQPYVYNLVKQQNQFILKPNTQNRNQEEPGCKIESVKPDSSPLHSFWKFVYQQQKEMQVNNNFEAQAIQCRKILIVPFEKGKLIEGNYELKIETFANDKSKENFLLDKQAKNQEPNLWQRMRIDLQKLLNFTDYSSSTHQSNTLSAVKTLKEIKVTPAPLPPLPPPAEILTFSSKIPIYRESATVKNGTAASEPSSSAQLPTTPIKLNWVIANPETIKELQLTIFALGLDGATATPSTIIYRLQKGVPVNLPCQLRNQLLICENVPIETKTPGQYKFNLTAIPTEKVKEISKSIEAVQIKPMLPQIENFQVNNQDTLENPNQVFTINPAKGPMDVFLTWKVKNPTKVTVELLPAPGIVAPSKNEIKYSLSPSPGSKILTLKVTNQVGESITRSVVLETTPIVSPTVKSSTQRTPSSPPNGAMPSSTVPSKSGELQPFELPPKTN